MRPFLSPCSERNATFGEIVRRDLACDSVANKDLDAKLANLARDATNNLLISVIQLDSKVRATQSLGNGPCHRGIEQLL